MGLREISVDVIAERLRKSKRNGQKTCIFIGAGISYTAGIPLAYGFIEHIKDEYPKAYANIISPTYASCMDSLTRADQVQIVRKYVDEAKINWAHIGIARMERDEYVDTILTTNFDPLASRACALFHRFPAVYDLAGLRNKSGEVIEFEKSFIKGSAIFHLHGQHTGFRLFNSEDELKNQAARIRPVLDAVMKGKPVIIAGYSGENDPLIDQIAELAPFNHGLYWVCHDDSNPSSDVCTKLLNLNDCHIVRNMPGDKFFTDLANTMELQAPVFLAEPFDHMLGVLEKLKPYSDTEDGKSVDLLEQAKKLLSAAANRQRIEYPNQAEIVSLMSEGKFYAVWNRFGSDSALNAENKDMVAGAAIILGVSLSIQAEIKQGAEADALFQLAGEKYAAALAIKSDMKWALINWGYALSTQATTKQGAEADELFWLAEQKYAASLAIKPDEHEALTGWGISLSKQAKTKQGAEADALFSQAGQKYAAALAIKPDNHEALNNWGIALYQQAKMKQGMKANELFRLAGDKYAAALAIKPDKHEVFFNWGVVLSDQADASQGSDADALFRLAGEKYAAALAIKPDGHEVLTNWGTTLYQQANMKQGVEAYELFRLAEDKYAEALVIKPDKYQAFYNWGLSLYVQAKINEGAEADELFRLSREKYASALAIKPDEHEVLTSWGISLSVQAKAKQGAEADALFSQAGEKYAAALAIKPDKHQALTNWGASLSVQAKMKRRAEAGVLLAKALDKLHRAEALKLGSSAYNIACVYGLKNNAKQAAHWLKIAKDKNRNCPNCDHIFKDTDFDLVRNTSEFKQALINIGCG